MIARTGLGELQGVTQNGVTVFRGVPYARAPRFSAPVPVDGWSGVRAADRDGPIAPQAPSRLRAAMGDFTLPMDEDCLTLSIWTPAADAARRPVLVWLHGGAWQSGAGSLPWYDGARLARDGDIVVVGVNYRLGALGWLHHPAVGPANRGALDQVAALQWVRDHIAAFGGDAARVTLMGQSAGASAIGRLLLDPVARPLFHAAILQSGSFGRPPLTAAEAEVTAEAFCDLLGVTPVGLHDVPVARLLEAQGALARRMARFGETNPPFMPVLDQPMAPARLLAAIARAAAGMPVLIGVTRAEVHAFYAADPAMEDPDPAAVAARFAALGEDPARARARRPAGTAMDLLADIASDHTFVRPSMHLAEALACNGSAVFAYRFDWAPAGSRFGACHCIELPFVFGTFPAWQAPMLAGGDEAAMQALSARLRWSWTRFVRSGDPAGDGLDWPAYEMAQRRTLLLGDRIEVVGDPAGLGAGA